MAKGNLKVLGQPSKLGQTPFSPLPASASPAISSSGYVWGLKRCQCQRCRTGCRRRELVEVFSSSFSPCLRLRERSGLVVSHCAERTRVQVARQVLRRFRRELLQGVCTFGPNRGSYIGI